MIEIRAETPKDSPAIRQVLEQAFAGTAEANLVERLRQTNKVLLSLVALKEGQLVGYVLFSPVTIVSARANGRDIGLAPIAVHPAYQNQGIGSRLIREGLSQCRQAGYDIVVVLGDSNYYTRFGFSRASHYGLDNEYDADQHFMALELKDGLLTKVSGLVQYAPEFSEADC